ncbi:hydroxymethylpyrimidine/phosphomethylpyrimidine kinase [Prosthecobacter debontii]|uniref:hydroxymethylpyrimidine kinase n=1 Tax=Prosthecobacter debontii TaxID=48467 RepID=A0A1T4XTA8_9BACT|nr:bifunctional hydroxymethylpyrimidine kinase/phosphomethylpyrimidine kinase [Prosthecobacter debontii]SKA92764.1 hydroxymethylpyrimidine/phosphomethylpyrimidine kinase [Prosthecobacter debontii]
MLPPPILTIAGSDSSCGAGVQADLKAISALGCYALNALTSVVSETPGRVSKVCLLDADLVADQIRVLLDAFPIAAAKTGMLGGRSQVEAVVQVWKERSLSQLPLVVDPVMVATGGGKLLEDDAIEVVKTQLLPLATLITPNMDEAAVLWDRPVTTRQEMAACAQDLAAAFGTAVLVKGGHLIGAAADVLYMAGEKLHWFESERTVGVQTHGTGCTYSASIATGLGLGMDLPQAIDRAKRYVSAAISDYFAWKGSAGTVHALNHLTNSAL